MIKNKDQARSLVLWNMLLTIISTNNFDGDSFKRYLWVRHDYYYYKMKKEWKDSLDVTQLRYGKWLIDSNGSFVSPSGTIVSSLSSQYDTSSYAAIQLIRFLRIPFEDPQLSLLTPTQRNDIKLAEAIKKNGINSPEELQTVFDKAAAFDRQQSILSSPTEHRNEKKQQTALNPPGQHDRRNTPKYNHLPLSTTEDDIDSDEFSPKAIDYQKKIEKAKAKSEAEIDLIEQMEELQDRVIKSAKYSYAWLMALLDLEMRESNENTTTREVSITFGQVVQESESSRTLILKQPSNYIPRFMEELADIPLTLEYASEKRNLPIEVINIHSYTLRVKIKPNYDMSNLRLHEVTEARIVAQNPVFLLEELKKSLLSLELDDDFDMQKNLCENIDFIFGPPGTGKTTYLANEVIIPMMKQQQSCRVLVLTPTNKAADVIARKIQAVMGDDTTYIDWLIRFGSTDDKIVEESGVYKDRTIDLRSLERAVVITTIDRFPYDMFIPNGERHYLKNLVYDFIIFDEASMIPLAKILFPLYHSKPQKFIVAGDPFQIEPVFRMNLWKDENIYSMIKLDSFSTPHTIPFNYPIKLLTEQYRSIPLIGDLFSNMTYDGILSHHRSNGDHLVIDFGDKINIKPLNIIKFPVSKYESIYRVKRLKGSSSYQIYSALFTYEFTRWLAKQISENTTNQKIRIGIIAPYKTQADMIERLIASENNTQNINIKAGTIHGFQGDECEIIISLYNPPPSIPLRSQKPDMFLHKKNIINVSISRARDYLFILMPDDDTENVDNLVLIKEMETYIKGTDQYAEFDAHFLESIMFGSSTFLEDNTFSTGHQNVNVYGMP